ncbi:MAG: hypothetical protein ACJAXA_002818 [Candidatus Aldehydirespiratoraceae bacterium]|jgi:hypothetical protein
MNDDDLIAGAAAPRGARWIRSLLVLDATWVVVVALAMIGSSFFSLVDLPDTKLRTGDDPLRFFVLGCPAFAIVAAVVGVIRHSAALAAVGAGVLAPSIALTGSLSLALFLDKQAAFADIGVAFGLGAALLGLAMLLRWFVYHPMSMWKKEARPVIPVARGLIGCGALTGILVLSADIGGGLSDWASLARTILVLLVPALAVAAGIARTLPAMALAAAACIGQIVAVVVVRAEQSSIPLDSDLVLRTGLLGMLGLATCAAIALVALRFTEVDDDIEVDDDPSWRWSADD